ncbi:MAG: aminopeptidase P family protein [Acidobacteria bacterium]|nr:aminopeptidase P family protein [Acidobacteriota bacterium]
MESSRIPRRELEERMGRLQAALRAQGLDGAVILQRADLIYYTDSVFQGALIVPAEGTAGLFVWRGEGLLSPLCPLAPTVVRGMGKLPAELAETEWRDWHRIGFEEDVLPVALWKHVGAVWPAGERADVSPLIRSQRQVKSDSELVRVRRSGRALSEGFNALRRLLREGRREFEVQMEMEMVLRRAGDQAGGRSRAFNSEARGVVACGSAAAVETAFDGPIGQPGRNPLAPFGAGGGEIRPNTPVIVDVTAGIDGYLTDMTRTFYLGKLDKRFREAHAFCVHVLEEMTRRLVPGAVPEELYLWAVEQAEAAGWAEHFMNRGRNKVRFLAHGIGLELDELPVLARRFCDPLQENMVIAVEPKVVFEDGGVGVEDTLIVKPGGAEIVTPMERGLIRLPD